MPGNNNPFDNHAPFPSSGLSPYTPGNEKPSKAVNSFNILRALICLQIVTVHLYPNPFEADRWMRYLYVGSESFFVIAGYFTAYGFRPGHTFRLSMRAFLTRRMLRLAVPYWVSVAIGFVMLEIVRLFLPNVGANPPIVKTLPNWLFLNGIFTDTAIYHYRGPTWFMSPLIQFIVIWTLVFWTVRRFWLSACPEDYPRRTIVTMIAIASICFGLSVGTVVFEGSYLPPTQNRWMLGHRAMFLFLGCFAYWQTTGILPKWVSALAAVIAIVLGISMDYTKCFWAGVVSLIVPVAVCRPMAPDFWITRILSRIGVISYSIYLTHLYAGAIVGRCLLGSGRNLASLSSGAIATILALQLVAVVLLGAAFYYLVELPALKRSKTIVYREGPTSEGSHRLEFGNAGKASLRLKFGNATKVSH